MLRELADRLTAFYRDTTGSYSVEAALVLPTLIWGSLSALTYVDGYRAQTMNLRTTYSIADYLSRQWDPVGPSDLDGLARVHTFLTNDARDTHLRVTVVYCNENDTNGCDQLADERRFRWSYSSPDGAPEITSATLDEIEKYIPVMAYSDTAIVVETWLDYVPPFSIGLPNSRFYNRVVVSPRFVPQLNYDPSL